MSYQNLVKLKGHKPYFQWVNQHWSSRGIPLEFYKHKYLVQIYKDQHPEIVWKKGAQGGGTERSITEAIWLADQFKENALYLMPTSGVIGDMVQERVDEPINNSKYLSGRSGRLGKVLSKQTDKVGLKRLGKGFVYFRGSQNANQITSVPADVVFVDERDRMIEENVPYFFKRLLHSARKWKRTLGTPTIPGFGVDAEYEKSDQREYLIKCNGCNEWQHLNFEENVVYDWDDNNKIVSNEKLICKKCKKIVVPWECQTDWVRKNRNSDIHGYFIHQLYSPFLDLKELVKDSKKTAIWELQQFFNQDLGLAYEPVGAKITEEIIKSCIRDYTIPFAFADVAVGIDVGKVLHVVTRSKDKIVDIRKCEHFLKDDGPDSLEEYLIARQPKKIVIDALPETRSAMKLAKKFPGRVFLCYYSGLKEVKEDEIKKGIWYKVIKGEPVVHTDRTLSLDSAFDQLKQQNCFMPKNIDDYLEFKAQVKSLVRVIIEDSKGNKKAEYKNQGEDHFGHAYNYATIASDMMSRIVMPEIFTI